MASFPYDVYAQRPDVRHNVSHSEGYWQPRYPEKCTQQLALQTEPMKFLIAQENVIIDAKKAPEGL